jgi:hypothetical protein
MTADHVVASRAAGMPADPTGRRAPATVDVAPELRQYGAASAADLLAAVWMQAVRAEAIARQPRARRTVRAAYEVYAGGTSVRSPSRYHVATGGSVLRALHADPSLRRTLRELTGSTMTPTRSAYLYYRPGDHMGLHTDVPDCRLTVLVPTIGTPAPLTVFPTLAGTPPRALGRWSRHYGGLLPGGRPVGLPAAGFLLLYGHLLPHQRERVADGPVVGVASLCFRAGS